MLSKRHLYQSVLISSAMAALQSAPVFARSSGTPAPSPESPIAAVSDEGQLNAIVDTQNSAQSHEQIEQEVQEGTNEPNNDAHESIADANEAQQDANEAKNDAQEAQRDANEATQEGGEHDSQNTGSQSGDSGANNSG